MRVSNEYGDEPDLSKLGGYPPEVLAELNAALDRYEEELLKALHEASNVTLDEFNPDQPRDPDGKFASTGGGGGKGAAVSSQETEEARRARHLEMAHTIGKVLGVVVATAAAVVIAKLVYDKVKHFDKVFKTNRAIRLLKRDAASAEEETMLAELAREISEVVGVSVTTEQVSELIAHMSMTHDEFDPNQPRNEQGEWTAEGGALAGVSVGVGRAAGVIRREGEGPAKPDERAVRERVRQLGTPREGEGAPKGTADYAYHGTNKEELIKHVLGQPVKQGAEWHGDPGTVKYDTSVGQAALLRAPKVRLGGAAETGKGVFNTVREVQNTYTQAFNNAQSWIRVLDLNK